MSTYQTPPPPENRFINILRLYPITRTLLDHSHQRDIAELINSSPQVAQAITDNVTNYTRWTCLDQPRVCCWSCAVLSCRKCVVDKRIYDHSGRYRVRAGTHYKGTEWGESASEEGCSIPDSDKTATAPAYITSHSHRGAHIGQNTTSWVPICSNCVEKKTADLKAMRELHEEHEEHVEHNWY